MKRKKLTKRLAKAVKSDTAWRCWFSDHWQAWFERHPEHTLEKEKTTWLK